MQKKQIIPLLYTIKLIRDLWQEEQLLSNEGVPYHVPCLVQEEKICNELFFTVPIVFL